MICSQMTAKSSQNGLEALFASATLGKLLCLFMLDPEREFYQRELQRLTGAHLRQLQRDLSRLEASGLMESRVHGNRTYYRGVPGHPAFGDLRAAVLKTIGLGDRLREALEGLGDAVALAFIFGSVARGEDVAGSDVDLLVVGSATRRAVAAALAPAGIEVGRELNPFILSAEEFAAKRREGDHFLASVLADGRIWVVGDEAELAATS
jgi:predicted nucleotidyltransferase